MATSFSIWRIICDDQRDLATIKYARPSTRSISVGTPVDLHVPLERQPADQHASRMGDNEEKPCNFIKGLVILIYEFFFTTNLILNSMNRALASLRQTRDSARICIDKLKFVTPSNIHLVDMHEFYSF